MYTSKAFNFLQKGFGIMKTRNKAAALLTALAVSASAWLPALSVNAAFSDVEQNSQYREAITTLSKLNVINGYEDGSFGPKKEITRAEFTKLIVYMIGQGEMNTKITQFEDVSESHWANANICAAYNLGIVNGFSDTEFGPDKPVTFEQALKMIVCTLGYQNDAEAKGGYPEGYRSQATALDLNKGINGVAYTDNATREVVAQVLYNALEIKLREPNGSNKWETTDKTLLKDYLDVHKLKGTVVGIEESITSECNAGTLNPGFFAIDDDKTGEEYVIDFTEYTQSLSDMTAYLGKTIQIYYRQDDLSSDKWLVEIDNETYTNKEITISSYDLSEYSNYTLKYYPESSGKTANIRLDSSELTIRYNGRVVENDVTLDDGNTYSPEDALNQWLNSESANKIYGNVRLIDSGSTGKYNIVDIYDYETIVVYSAPVSPDYRITDKTKTGNFLILNPDSSDYKFTLTKNGSSIETTALATNDVISYALNLDGDYYTVYANSTSVTGTITQVNLNSNEPTISIDGNEYHISQRFIDYINDKDKSTLESGSKITAYSDIFGTLEWGTITKTTSFYPYAYVINAEQDGEDYYLKLFAPTTKTLTSFTSSTSYKAKSYKIQDNNPKLNSKKSSPDSIVAALQAHAELPEENIPKISGVKGTGYNQLIKVGFSETGEISDVITLGEDEDVQNEDGSKLVRFKKMDPEAKYYVTTSSVKASSTGTTYYSLKSSTPMFIIPKDRTNENGYSIKSAITSNSMVSGGSYYLDAYDLSTTKYPNVLIVYNTTFKSGTAITYSTAYRLISDDIKDEYDEAEGDIFNMLYTYNSASTVTKTKISPEYESDFAKLGKGDIILNGTDADKYADTFMSAIDYDDILSVLNGETTPVYDEEGRLIANETYNWTKEREQDAEHYYQKYVYDFRYPKPSIINAVSGGTDPDEADLSKYWVTGGNVTGISSRAFMVNIMQVLTDENMLYVTRDGFDESGNLNENNYMELKVSSSTKIVRYDKDKKEFTPYAQGTESTALTVQDLKDAQNYGDACSKALITYVSGSTTSSTATPTAKFIVIYE